MNRKKIMNVKEKLTILPYRNGDEKMKDKKLFWIFWGIASISCISYSILPALLGKYEIWNNLLLLPALIFVSGYFIKAYRDWRASKKTCN